MARLVGKTQQSGLTWLLVVLVVAIVLVLAYGLIVTDVAGQALARI